jgi:RNA polymerase-binding transcription factor DksA
MSTLDVKEVNEMSTSVKTSLEGERVRLCQAIARQGMGCWDGFGYGNHPADHATGQFEQLKSLALRQNLEALLAQVEEALNRWEQGIYGICERCGLEIDPARLTALLYATLCLRCKNYLESVA